LPGILEEVFDEAGVELDLGGIAKGYAVDRVVRLLRDRHVSAALVDNGGSTIYWMGAPPGLEGWDVAIQDSLDSAKVARTVRLKDRALSVAGSSEKYFEVAGRRYSHIMVPRTGTPVQGVLSVAVLAASGTAGDALDDAFFVLGPKRSGRLMTHNPATDVWFFLPAANRSWTAIRGTAR
jgi:thiamine biosynthesis lipoprotein